MKFIRYKGSKLLLNTQLFKGLNWAVPINMLWLCCIWIRQIAADVFGLVGISEKVVNIGCFCAYRHDYNQ